MCKKRNDQTSHDNGEAILLEVAGKGYTQTQVSTMAFNTFRQAGNVEAGYLLWQKVVENPDFSLKDYAFLILYFVDKVATDDIQEIIRPMTDHVRRYTQ